MLGSLVMVMAVLSGLLVGSGNATKVLGLGDGLGWVIDNSGDVPVVAGLSVSSDDVDRRQVPGGELVTIVDPETGEVVFVQRRVGGRLEWVRVGRGDKPSPVAPAAGEGDQLVVSGGGRVWLVDRSAGSVMLLAGTRKAPKPVSVGRIEADLESFAAVDGSGRLFVATTTGVRILGVSRGRPITMGSVASPQGLSSLVSVGGDVVGVSAGSGSAAVFAGARVRTRMDLGVSSRGLLVPSRSTGSVLWVLDPGSGRVSGTSTEGRRVAVLSLPRVVGDWNPPAAVGGVVMVSAVVDGAVRVWRGSSESPNFVEVRFGEFESMAVCGPGGCPEFFESGGRGWMNDPAGDAVLVIDPSGGVRRLGKGEDGAGSGGGASNGGQGRVDPAGAQSKALPPKPFKALPVQPRSSVEAQVRGLNSGNRTRGGETGRASGPTPPVIHPEGVPPDGLTDVDPDPIVSTTSIPQLVPQPCDGRPEVAGDQSTPPPMATGVTATTASSEDGNGTITMRWTRGESTAAVCGFRIRLTGPGMARTESVGPTTTEWVAIDIRPGTYQVVVIPFNNAGDGPASVPVEVVVEEPPLVAEPGPDAIRQGDCIVDRGDGGATPGRDGARWFQGFKILTSGCETAQLFVAGGAVDGEYRFGPCTATVVGTGISTNGCTGTINDPACDWVYFGACTPGLLPLGDNISLLTPRETSVARSCLTVTDRSSGSTRTYRDAFGSGDPVGELVPGVMAPDPCAELLQGDVNNDGRVGCRDVNLLLTHWRESGVQATYFDQNGNRVVDGIDLSIVLSRYTGDDVPTCNTPPESP